MKKILLYLAFSAIVTVHFMMLYYFGISTFTTTLLVYFLIYQFLKIIYYIFLKKYAEIITYNTRLLFILMLCIEFFLTFIYKQFNNGMENYRYMYFSHYKTQEQYMLLKKIRPNNTITPSQNGHFPNSTEIISNNEFTYKHTYNADGFRDNHLLCKLDTNNYNIIFLGDSFIEGEGAPNDSTLPILLHQTLKNNLSNNQKKIAVYNCGISGSNPLYEIELYKRKVEKYHPNLVLLAVFENDLEDMEIAFAVNKNLPLKEYFIAISHIYRITSIITGGNYLSLNNTSNENKKKRNEIITNFITEMKKFNNYLEEKHVKLRFVYLPSSEEFYCKQLEILKLNTSLRERLTKEFPNTINIHSEFLKKGINCENRLNYYWEKNGHFNSKGYELAARIIKSHLIEFDSIYKNK